MIAPIAMYLSAALVAVVALASARASEPVVVPRVTNQTANVVERESNQTLASRNTNLTGIAHRSNNLTDLASRAVNLTAACGRIAQQISSSSALYYPGTTGYDGAVKHWFLSSSDTAACAVEPGTTRDLAKILDIIKQNRVPFAVKSGGHIQQPGFSSTKGVHIAMRRFDEITYHPTAPPNYKLFAPNGSVTIGVGRRWNEVYDFLAKFNVTVAGARVTNVGVGGYTLGGGYSFHANQVGMTVDTILSFEVVLPSGEVRTVTATSDSGLFWALKISNNFGIVTRITFKALPYSGVWGGILSYGANPTAVFNAVLNFEEKVKDPKANIIISVNYMNGTPAVGVVFFYDAPTPAPKIFDELMAIPHTVAAPLVSRSLANMTTVTSQDVFAGAFTHGRYNNVMVAKNTPEYLDSVWNECSKHGTDLRTASSGFSVVYTVEPMQRDYLTRPKRTSDSAFPPTWSRKYGGMPMLISYVWNEDAGSEAHQATLHESGQKLWDMQTAINNGTRLQVYPNYAMSDHPVADIYGAEGVTKLKRVANRVDPHNVMSLAGGWKV